jgi:hypothetical protein
LIELLEPREKRLRAKAGRVDLVRSRRRVRRELRKLTDTMRQLLNEPQVAERVIKQMQTSPSPPLAPRRRGGSARISPS